MNNTEHHEITFSFELAGALDALLGTKKPAFDVEELPGGFV